MNADSIVIDAMKASLVNQIRTAEWAKNIQDNVKEKILWIINNIETVGLSFQKTFITLFKWEQLRRKVQEITSTPIGTLLNPFPIRLSEETYQCGKLPTRAVLDLYDYVNPNDADVAACIFLCKKIEAFEQISFLQAKNADDGEAKLPETRKKDLEIINWRFNWPKQE